MSNPVIAAIETQRTTNLYDPARSINAEQIGELIRLATTAPTAFNLQNWRFIAVHSAEAKGRLQVAAWGQPKIIEAAVTFIVCGQIPEAPMVSQRLAAAVEAGIMPAETAQGWEGGAKMLYEDKPARQRDEAVRSATFGAGTLIQAAQAMGLGTTPMIGFDPAVVASEFALASDEVPVLLVAVGYATADNWPRKPRRPVSDVLSIV